MTPGCGLHFRSPELCCVKKLLWCGSATMGKSRHPPCLLHHAGLCPLTSWAWTSCSSLVLPLIEEMLKLYNALCLFLLFFWMLFHQSVSLCGYHSFNPCHFPIGLEAYNASLPIYSQDCLCDFQLLVLLYSFWSQNIYILPTSRNRDFVQHCVSVLRLVWKQLTFQ